MKINITNILLGVLILMMAWGNFSGDEIKEPVPITITLPEMKGNVGRTLEDVKITPVYLPSKNEHVNVDSEWKRKYELAKDSLEKTNLYLEAIKINEYDKILVDNDSLKITGYARTRGSLLDYSVDYDFKPSYTYIPKVVLRRPSLSIGVGVQFGVPTLPSSNFIAKGDIYFENNKGNGFSVGYDTERHIWVGLRKTFTLKK